MKAVVTTLREDVRLKILIMSLNTLNSFPLMGNIWSKCLSLRTVKPLCTLKLLCERVSF